MGDFLFQQALVTPVQTLYLQHAVHHPQSAEALFITKILKTRKVFLTSSLLISRHSCRCICSCPQRIENHNSMKFVQILNLAFIALGVVSCASFQNETKGIHVRLGAGLCVRGAGLGVRMVAESATLSRGIGRANNWGRLDEIKSMARARLSDDTIISHIKESRSIYRLSNSDKIELRDAGVSQRVIDYMISTRAIVPSLSRTDQQPERK